MIKKNSLTFILLALLASGVIAQNASESQEIPKDFKSDGCTLFPDGNYRDCCVAHDRDYYKGGTCKERSESDKRLYRCVKNKGKWYNKIVAPMMWVGVRVGGVSFLPTPFRWGFGKKKKKKKHRKKVKKEKRQKKVKVKKNNK